jgi:hypothetical protein
MTASARPGRLLGPLLLLAVTGAVLGLIVSALPGSHTAPRQSVRPAPAKQDAVAPPVRQAPTTPAAPVLPTPAQARAAAVEAHGHALLVNGSPAAAIPVLHEAIAATGEGAAACVQPRGPNCFTYAYALFDLGRALRLSGDAAAAVAILEARLRINDHRGIVAAELALAREAAG